MRFALNIAVNTAMQAAIPFIVSSFIDESNEMHTVVTEVLQMGAIITRAVIGIVRAANPAPAIPAIQAEPPEAQPVVADPVEQVEPEPVAPEQAEPVAPEQAEPVQAEPAEADPSSPGSARTLSIDWSEGEQQDGPEFEFDSQNEEDTGPESDFESEPESMPVAVEEEPVPVAVKEEPVPAPAQEEPVPAPAQEEPVPAPAQEEPAALGKRARRDQNAWSESGIAERVKTMKRHK